MISLNKEFSEKIERFLERMKGNYKLEKPSEKIEKFYEFSFNEFVTEMRKRGRDTFINARRVRRLFQWPGPQNLHTNLV